MTEMNSMTALGFLLAGTINTALTTTWDEGESARCCPDCCGPCASLKWYRDNAAQEADVAMFTITPEPSNGYDWQDPLTRGINWESINQVWATPCPNADFHHEL